MLKRFAKTRRRAFFKHAGLLCCRAAPVKNRLLLLNSLVSNSLLWCSGSWNLTTVQLSKTRGLQQELLQKMIVVQRGRDEPMDEFMERWRSRIKSVKEAYSFEDWDRRYHRSVFHWAGHVARMQQYDSQRVTYRVLQHKCWEKVRMIAAQNNGNQMHGRYFRTWRWERPLFKYFEEQSWMEVAQDKLYWLSLLDEMVTWRTTVR